MFCFLFKQKTADEMRISDWSSDVCSSDLKVAMFLKLVFLEGQRRRKLFETGPLARVWIISERLAMPRDGISYTQRGMIAFAWFVWEHGHQGSPTLGWV